MQPIIKKFNLEKEYYIDEGCFICELSNSDNDPDLSIAKARVEPGVTTKLHKLSATIERYVVLEGEGLVELEGLGSQKLSKNDVAIIPPNCSQKITNIGVVDLVFLAICSPRFKPDIYKPIEE